MLNGVKGLRVKSATGTLGIGGICRGTSEGDVDWDFAMTEQLIDVEEGGNCGALTVIPVDDRCS